MGTPQPQKHIIILGAGITGLSSALRLNNNHKAPRFHITIIASHFPGDESINYTSPWAGADWSPQAIASTADAEMRGFDKTTYDTWNDILENDPDEAKNLGMAFKECRIYWGRDGPETEGHDGRGLWWREIVKEFEVLDLEKEEGVPDGAVMGVKYLSICVNVPQHLQYLMEKVRIAGLSVIKAGVDVSNGLEGVVRDAKRLLIGRDKDLKEENILALVNCTGLGARHFVGDLEAAKLFPIRGQIVIVRGESTLDLTYDDFPSSSTYPDELTYVIPRPGSGTTVLGGCKQDGNWDPRVDEHLNGRVIERIKKWGLAEELRMKEGKRDFEIVKTPVGLRPGRKGGPRLEVEGTGPVEGVWVVHSYGHAGAGYQNSIGSSEKVARLVGEIIKR